MDRPCHEATYKLAGMARTAEKRPRQAILPGAVAEVLLDRIAQGVLTLSSDGRVTYANRSVAAMAGVSRSSLLGSPLR